MIARSLVVVAVLGAFSSAALAADLPNTKGPPAFLPPPSPLLSWTGFYLGGNVGGAWGDFQNTYAAPGGAVPYFLPADAAAISANGSNRLRPFGFAGGVQAATIIKSMQSYLASKRTLIISDFERVLAERLQRPSLVLKYRALQLLPSGFTPCAHVLG